MRKIRRLIDLDNNRLLWRAPHRLSHMFKLVMWGSLLCTGILLSWFSVIVVSWYHYGYPPINPFLLSLLLFVTLLFTLLSASLVRVIRYERDIQHGYADYGDCLGCVAFSLVAIWVSGIFVMLIGGILLISEPIVDAPMTRAGFVYQHITLVENERVRFINPGNGNIQVLCVGNGEECLAGNGIPDELAAPGLRLLPGQASVVTFHVAGDYPVRSLSTPGISMTIHVMQPNTNVGSQATLRAPPIALLNCAHRDCARPACANPGRAPRSRPLCVWSLLSVRPSEPAPPMERGSLPASLFRASFVLHASPTLPSLIRLILLEQICLPSSCKLSRSRCAAMASIAATWNKQGWPAPDYPKFPARTGAAAAGERSSGRRA